MAELFTRRDEAYFAGTVGVNNLRAHFNQMEGMLRSRVGQDKDIDPFEENRQRQVVGLIRTNFLKRFESSVAAFELSCDRLLKKLLAFLDVHSVSDAELSGGATPFCRCRGLP